MRARVGIITFELSLPGATSLKAKRARLRPLVESVRRRFHVSTAEIGLNDIHDRAMVAAAVVGSDTSHIERQLSSIATAAENFDVRIDDYSVEVI
ncbi:MAG: DUF503 domain-containing protein [Candidatus Hydrogenedentota bacterium]